jgi:hypothetical protein
MGAHQYCQCSYRYDVKPRNTFCTNAVFLINPFVYITGAISSFYVIRLRQIEQHLEE